MSLSILLWSALLHLLVSSAFSLDQSPPLEQPQVKLDNATVTGKMENDLTMFLGIPFAQPPVGDRRFRVPEALPPYTDNFTAVDYGPSCPQQNVSDLPIPTLSVLANISNYFNDHSTENESEDCLTISIIRPPNATAESNLPVVLWIYGGGFETGDIKEYDDNAAHLVTRSIELDKPVIYAAMNYRQDYILHTFRRTSKRFGFLASREVEQARVGNLGLRDQREAMRWVNKYIVEFGGDPNKTILWGESAGAISISLQMLVNDGDPEGLFRGAFMQSGAPIPVGNVTGGQKYYDVMVDETGCSGSNDTLACLRTVPYGTLKTAIDRTPNYYSYQSLVLAWSPRADGEFLPDNPQRLVQQGKVANVSMAAPHTGNCDDEGTVFSLSSLNVTDDDEFRQYIEKVWIPEGNSSEIDRVLQLYPADVVDGSPFNTWIFNALTGQYKRIAAFQGDVVFQASRRSFLQQRSGKQKIWSFLSKHAKETPFLGSVSLAFFTRERVMRYR
ncbi:Alpha/Beta hydrolase protein [Cyathus striatus]|nr:Alpha/Beta hydrolase protein [Cyathus striatus]